MRAAARAGRFVLLLALLLVLLGVSATVVSRDGDAGPRHQVIGESVSTSPSVRDDLHDWLRVTGVARSVLITAPQDTGWAVCPRAADECAPRGWSLVGEAGGAGAGTARTTSRSSRAPPVDVN